jgi:N-acyl-D-aspartate/D-glutamate deacylase
MPGARADIVLFDAAHVRDNATFEEPHQYPEGIPYVIVNGIVTVDNGRFLDLRPGVVLRAGSGRASRAQPVQPRLERTARADG